jgi:hypothetical protein
MIIRRRGSWLPLLQLAGLLRLWEISKFWEKFPYTPLYASQDATLRRQ